jgi:mono/diheme cytochrome c family protein
MRVVITVTFMAIFAACMEAPNVNMQQVAHGQQLYETHCSNCHQLDGKGIARIIPPLLNADYITQNRNLLPQIIHNGMQKTIVVNGVNYQQKMPGNNKLTDEELTALINFVEFRFAKSTQLLSLDSVRLLMRN